MTNTARTMSRIARDKKIRHSGAKEWDYWLRVAQAIQEKATADQRTDWLRCSMRLVGFLVHVAELKRLFIEAPNGEIDGDRGVAAMLGISRHAVYLRTKSVGLAPSSFRSADVTLDQLLDGNEVFWALVLEAKKVSDEAGVEVS